ncbi:MAG: GldL-related protein [Flavobacterium sp.]
MKAVFAILSIVGNVIGIFGLLFKLLHWPGAHLMLLVSGVLIVISAILILLKFFTQNKQS